ncbi:MAG: hypothetical protein ACERKD_04680 [Prolixibacteraceae bacterium]
MKKVLSLVSAIALFAIIFTSCTEDIISDLAPEIIITAPVADTTQVFIGDTLTFNVSLSSENTLSSFQTLTGTPGIDITDGNAQYTTETTASLSVGTIVTDVITDGTVIEISFTVVDKNKQTTVKKYILAKSKATPLTEAADLTWERKGGTAATGLDMFGLTWTSNTATSAIIKKGAEKFVQLEAATWMTIDSKETLMEAIDTAENMDQYEGISSTENKTHDITLGTIKEGTYYLIHITNSTVSVDAVVGTTITIVGQYKL